MVEVAADMKDAVMDEKIIGTDSVTLTEHGAGAREPKVLPSPHQMLPAQKTRTGSHIFHMTRHVICASNASDQSLITEG